MRHSFAQLGCSQLSCHGGSRLVAVVERPMAAGRWLILLGQVVKVNWTAEAGLQWGTAVGNHHEAAPHKFLLRLSFCKVEITVSWKSLEILPAFIWQPPTPNIVTCYLNNVRELLSDQTSPVDIFSVGAETPHVKALLLKMVVGINPGTRNNTQN